MAVLMQELLSPAYSFVIHTASPLGNDPATAEAEVAAGLGETLASGQRGSAWRLAVNKSTGAVATLAFANFSEALLPVGAGAAAGVPAPQLAGVGPAGSSAGGGGGLYSRSRSPSSSMSSSPGSSMASVGGSESDATPGVVSSGGGSLYECASRTMDYSRHPLSQSSDARIALGRRIGAVASCLERSFGGAQDVEGCLVGETLFVVQTRPQP